MVVALILTEELSYAVIQDDTGEKYLACSELNQMFGFSTVVWGHNSGPISAFRVRYWWTHPGTKSTNICLVQESLP